MADKAEDSYLRPGLGRYIANYGSNLLVVLTSFAALKLCLLLYGQEAFEVYAVSRRVLAVVIALVASGWGVSLSYHIASAYESEKSPSVDWLLVTLAQFCAIALPVSLGAFWFPEGCSFLCFGDSKFSYLTIPITMLCLANSLAVFAVNMFNGRMQILWASSILVCCQVVAPLLSFLIFPGSLANFFSSTALLTLFFCSILGWLSLRRQPLPSVHSSFFSRDKHLKILKYALPRLPGGFLVVALLNIPVTLATHFGESLSTAGAMSVGVSLVGLVAVGVTPISNVTLPQAAFLKARDRGHEMLPRVYKILFVLTLVVVVYILSLSYLMPFLLRHLLSKDLIGYGPTIISILPAALPYAYFRCFRGILDGAEVRALTTRNAIVSWLCFCVIFAVLHWGFRIDDAVILGVLAALSCLGGLTLFQIRSLLLSSEAKGREHSSIDSRSSTETS